MSVNYSRLIFTLVTFGICLSAVYSQPAIKNGKFFGKYEIPKNTPQPININSSKAENVDTKPLYLIGHTEDRFNLVNTGRSLELILAQPNAKSRLIAFDDVYKFYKKQYYWNSNGTGVAGTTVDDEDGTVLEIFAYFFKEKLGTFENALNYRGSMIDISFRVQLSNVLLNPLFQPFDESIREVRKPGSSSATTLGEALRWYSIFPPNVNYYAYPGSYLDEITGKEYFCSTTIILPHYSNMFISRSQFENTFGSLKNSQGRPLGRLAVQHPSDGIPIVKGKGIVQILIPNQS